MSSGKSQRTQQAQFQWAMPYSRWYLWRIALENTLVVTVLVLALAIAGVVAVGVYRWTMTPHLIERHAVIVAWCVICALGCVCLWRARRKKGATP